MNHSVADGLGLFYYNIGFIYLNRKNPAQKMIKKEFIQFSFPHFNRFFSRERSKIIFF